MKPGKKALLFILKLSVSGSLLYYVLRKAGIANVLGTIGGIHPAAFMGAVALYLIAQLVSSMRWRLLVESRLGLKKFYSLYLLGSFFNTILPGLVGGDAVKAYYFYKQTGNLAEGAASIFMERYLGFIALLLVAFMAYPFGLPYLRDTGLTWFLPILFGGFVIASFVFFTFRIGRRLRFLEDIYGYFERYRKTTLAKGVLLSFGVQGLTVFAVYTIALGLHVAVSLPLFFIFVPLIVTFSFVPISISGIGLREASFVLLFGSVGLAPQTATALSFAWFLSMAAGSLTGLVEYLRIKKGATIKGRAGTK
ncbi:MAG: lysylphosphatidylglycerol synthase transmembrane domain-containing protein [Nitrospiraceae bacterium]|nr:lysylphosphatidylglycerol synthase transmembrane domain-containing protein [Nitrospiraceae bacterium]